MDTSVDEQTDLLERLEQQFEDEVSCGYNECDEPAVWCRMYACCGAKKNVCSLHKYGKNWETGMPLFPTEETKYFHVPCNKVRTWIKVLTEDAWTRI